MPRKIEWLKLETYYRETIRGMVQDIADGQDPAKAMALALAAFDVVLGEATGRDGALPNTDYDFGGVL